MRRLWSETRFAWRALRGSPGVTIAAVLTLGVGIGANTALFSVMNAVILRPLPWKDPERLIGIWESNPKRGWPQFSTSGPNYLDWKEKNAGFDPLAAWRSLSFNLTGTSETERILGGAASADLLPMLGTQPFLGRNFLEAEDRKGSGAKVAILGNGLWQRQFGSDPEILGRAVTLNNEPYTVVGILPADFDWIGPVDAIVPLGPQLDDNRGNHVLSVFGRLRPGTDLSRAQTDMEGIARSLGAQYPASNDGWGIRTATFDDWIVGPEIRGTIFVLMGAVGLVLLIACVNTANLVLSRAADRRKEIALRLALGAGSGNLVSQLLAECLMISLAGGALGSVLALWGVDLLRALDPGGIPRLGEVSVDGRALLFTLAASIIAGLVSGLAPALQVLRPGLIDALREGSDRATAGRSRGRTRRALVVSELALSLILLIGAALLLESFWRLQAVSLGFRPDNLLTFQITLPDARYSQEGRKEDFYRQVLERILRLPEVESAAASSVLPFAGGGTSSEVRIEGRDAEPDGTAPSADWRRISPGYFRTLGIPLLQGRDIEERDVSGTPAIVVISESMARRYWPGADPVGRRLSAGGRKEQWWTVAGVVGDVREQRLDRDPRPTIYFPLYQAGMYTMLVAVRTRGAAAGVSPDLRAAVGAVDREVPVSALRSMEEMVYGSSAPRRFTLVVLCLFAALAIVLASVGLYAVMAYSVAQRTHEIGIRMALGALRRDVVTMIVKQGMGIVTLGAAVGLVGSVFLTRTIGSMLYGVSPMDPRTLAMVTLFLGAVALAACWVPARRATKVDPVIALKRN